MGDTDGATAIPSAVSVEQDRVRVGRAALARAVMSPASTTLAVKSWLGRRRTDELASRRGLPPGANAPDPEEAAAHLMRALADLAEKQCQRRPTSVVLAAPPWLGSKGRAELQAAAARAGLTVSRLMSEATAAVLALPVARKPVEQNVAVIDVGAGGVSVSLLNVCSKKVVALASAGDDHVGGADIDQAIVQILTRDLAGRLPPAGAVAEMLRVMAETLKQDLSQAGVASAIASFAAGAPTITLDRDRVDPLFRPLCERLGAMCASVLDDAGLTRQRCRSCTPSAGSPRHRSSARSSNAPSGCAPSCSTRHGASWPSAPPCRQRCSQARSTRPGCRPDLRSSAGPVSRALLLAL